MGKFMRSSCCDTHRSSLTEQCRKRLNSDNIISIGPRKLQIGGMACFYCVFDFAIYTVWVNSISYSLIQIYIYMQYVFIVCG